MRRRPCDLTDGERACLWIEDWCVVPGFREKPVKLTARERAAIYAVYDAALWRGTSPEAGMIEIGITGPLAAYLVLYALVGPKAQAGAVAPRLAIDLFSIWGAASLDLRRYLVRRGATIICPQCGTSWAAAA